jgi:hypothetical protein
MWTRERACRYTAFALNTHALPVILLPGLPIALPNALPITLPDALPITLLPGLPIALSHSPANLHYPQRLGFICQDLHGRWLWETRD